MDAGTKETMPWVLWWHAVTTEAIRQGGDAEIVRSLHARAALWFQAGEPVWLAASGIRQLAVGHVRAAREDSERAVIRAALRR